MEVLEPPSERYEVHLAESFYALLGQYDKNIRPNYTGRLPTQSVEFRVEKSKKK